MWNIQEPSSNRSWECTCLDIASVVTTFPICAIRPSLFELNISSTETVA